MFGDWFRRQQTQRCKLCYFSTADRSEVKAAESLAGLSEEFSLVAQWRISIAAENVIT